MKKKMNKIHYVVWAFCIIGMGLAVYFDSLIIMFPVFIIWSLGFGILLKDMTKEKEEEQSYK